MYYKCDHERDISTLEKKGKQTHHYFTEDLKKPKQMKKQNL